ncbi:MAG: DNA polymerase III subunit delta' [Gammaproteobacteria bacterium HGW-Gammaproteobacteria-15]|nr:MAG: DNA polymerase III subunit delta' [Gammaproteobacteria bacterium HGW-Gammaproteobacteria-15]
MQPWLIPYQQQLTTLLQNNQLAHGLLISGPAGIGKSVLANWLAASLLCTEQLKPCGKCKSCLLRVAGSHSDLLIIDSSGSSIGVDSVRQLSQFMYGRAQQQVNKVVLLADAEKLTEAAANALLKTLEEPPQNSFLLLQTRASNTLAATLLSRCQHWTLAAEFGAATLHWLTQYSNRAVPEFLLTYCAGGPLKALSMLESGEADQLQLTLHNLNQFLADKLTLQDIVKQLDGVSELRQLLGWFLTQQLLPAMTGQDPQRILAIHQLYSRWCRDEMQILGQNKVLALSAFLTELKRLQG